VLSGVADISAAGYDTCALLSTGTVDCWGLNGNGQLGDGSTTDSLVPVQVVGEGGSGVLTGVSQVATGGTHTCALFSAGTTACWGWNYYGELGNGTTTGSSTPVEVLGL
jgi:alpha-tubulin suppressor-like RCC1 family protein